MKLIFRISLLGFVSMLVSCASVSTASVDKSENAKSFEKSENLGIVYLYRPGRAVGAASQTQIKINGLDAGGTGPGTFFRWELKPGNYKFSCYTPESSAVVEIDVKAGEHYFIRQDERMGLDAGRVTLKIIEEKTGVEAVKRCKLLISTYQTN